MRTLAFLLLGLMAVTTGCGAPAPGNPAASAAPGNPPAAAMPGAPSKTAVKSCFLLHELGVGEVARAPSEACRTRVTPASTFKIPHALAALDSGVRDGPDAKLTYDGSRVSFPVHRQDHTLASAMRHSVLWYFQRIAEKLGPAREKEYLVKFQYGNADPSSGLTTFWLGESLLISPEEQERFLIRLYEDSLPVSKEALRTVRRILIQPEGVVVNAMGEHAFNAPWPKGTVLSAKTGSSSNAEGQGVRWLVGHVARADRAWVFVSCVIGGADLAPLAAVQLASKSLRDANVL